MARTFAGWLTGKGQVSGPNRLVESNFGPMIININDKYVGEHIANYGVWEAEQLGLLFRLANFLVAQFGHITVYDVGANFGIYTLALAARHKDKIQVWAFEPQEQIFHMLCGTMALNNLENVHCHCAVVADVDGEILELNLPDYRARNNFGGFGISASNGEARVDDIVRSGRKQRVKTVTLDSFEETVHLIKIDVEGMEYKVLQGAEQTIRTSRPICFLEIHQPDHSAFRSFFAGHGYVVLPQGGHLLAIPQEHFAGLTRHQGPFGTPRAEP